MAPKPKTADIIAAAEACDKKKLESLLDAGGSPDALGKGGNSALHTVAAKGDTAAALATIKILLERGADCASENDQGDTAFAVAKKNKFNKVATVLEEATAAAAAAEEERRKAKKAAKAAKAKEEKKKAAEAAGVPVEEEGVALPYRRTAGVGWKPLSKDWMKYVKQWKHLTDSLTERKIAISFSNKSVDAAFAKALLAALTSEGAEVQLLDKWPVGGWIKACVWAVEEADFVVILHSSNYDEGHYCTAERFLVKESNVPHLTIELDKPDHTDYCESAASALESIKGGLVLSQKARVETNTMACTWAYSSLTKEDREVYNKITKVWTPKEESSAPLMLDLDQLAIDQAAAAAATAAKSGGGGGAQTKTEEQKAAEAAEVAELQNLFASGQQSTRR